MKREFIAKCCELFDVHPRDLMGPARFHFVTYPRFAAYKALKMRGWSYSHIGRFMGRDHSTVIHGVRRADYIASRDAHFKECIEILRDFSPEYVSQGESVDVEG